MKRKVSLKSQQRRGVMAFIPILFGMMVLVWGVWYLGFEQFTAHRINNIGKAHSVQSIIAYRLALKRSEMKSSKDHDYTADQIDDAVEAMYLDLLRKNNIE